MQKKTCPLVSIVIPCYNYGSYVADAIESIISQTYQNWELVVVNDGSKDNTEAIVIPYTNRDKRIRYHFQSNKGLSAARNIGIKMTTGEYIQLLDADDFLADRKLSLQVESLQNAPDIDLIYGDAYLFKHEISALSRKSYTLYRSEITPVSGSGVALLFHMAADNMFLPGSPLYRRSMHDIIGPFKEDMYPMEDWHYWYRGLVKGMRYLHDGRRESALHSRSHGDNMSGNRYKMWRNKIIARTDMLLIMKEQKTHAGESMQPVVEANKKLLVKEKARFNLLYGQVLSGMYYAMLNVLRDSNHAAAAYESAYLIKERLLGRNERGV